MCDWGVKDLQFRSKVLHKVLGSHNFVFVLKYCKLDIKKDLICSVKQSKKVLHHNPFENKSL